MLLPIGSILLNSQLGALVNIAQGLGIMMLTTSAYYFYEHSKKIPPFGPYNLVKHTFVQGKTGTGKSTFLINLALDMINRGYGCLWLDTHDQAWRLLSHIQEKDWDRVIFIRPQDDKRVVTLNLIENFTNSPNEIEDLGGEFIAIMKKANPSSWGSNIEAIVADAVLGILYAKYCDPKNFGDATTLDVERVITDESFRKRVINANTENYIVNQGLEDITKKFDRDKSLASAVTKFRAWLRSTYLMHFLCSPNGVNLRDEINNNKIIICNFDSSPIELGEINSQAIASIVVSKIKQVVMTRTPSNKFFLCIFDEFQTYCHNESFLQMVTECRKKNVGLVLACQSLGGQLASRNPLVASAMDQCGNHIYYRLGQEDAIRASKLFEDDKTVRTKGYNKYSQHVFLRLPDFYAVSMRLMGEKGVFVHKGKYPNDDGGSMQNALQVKAVSDQKPYVKSRLELKQIVAKRNPVHGTFNSVSIGGALGGWAGSSLPNVTQKP